MPRTDAALSGILIHDNDSSGYITLCDSSSGTFPTTASKFAIGCVLVDTTTGKSYRNAGTVAVPVWRPIQAYSLVAADTSGTQIVNVFSATVPFSATITSVQYINREAKAGTVTISCSGGQVAQFAKTDSQYATGAVVGAISLGSTAISAGGTLVVSSSTTAVTGTVLISFV